MNHTSLTTIYPLFFAFSALWATPLSAGSPPEEKNEELSQQQEKAPPKKEKKKGKGSVTITLLKSGKNLSDSFNIATEMKGDFKVKGEDISYVFEIDTNGFTKSLGDWNWMKGLDPIDTLIFTYKHDYATLQAGRKGGNFALIAETRKEILGKELSLKAGWHPKIQEAVSNSKWYWATTSLGLGYKKSSLSFKLCDRVFWVPEVKLTLGKSELEPIHMSLLKKATFKYAAKYKANGGGVISSYSRTSSLSFDSKEWEVKGVKCSWNFGFKYECSSDDENFEPEYDREFSFSPTFKVEASISEKLSYTLTILPCKYTYKRKYSEGRFDSDSFDPSSGIGLKLKYTF